MTLVHLHLLVSGCLLAWAFVAVDPVPRIGTDRVRLVLLFIALAGHDALAKLIYAGHSSVAGISADQLHLGAGISYRPGRHADRIAAPILFALVQDDAITPVVLARAAVARAPHAEVHTYPGGHFDVYVGATFERAVADQVEFLTRHLLGS